MAKKKSSSKSVSANQKAKNGIFVIKKLIDIGAIRNIDKATLNELVSSEKNLRKTIKNKKAVLTQAAETQALNAVIGEVRLLEPKVMKGAGSAYSMMLRAKNKGESLGKTLITSLVQRNYLPSQVLGQQKKQQKKQQAKQQNPFLTIWNNAFAKQQKQQAKTQEGKIVISAANLANLRAMARAGRFNMKLNQPNIDRYGAPFANMSVQDLQNKNLFAAVRFNLVSKYSDLLQSASAALANVNTDVASAMGEEVKNKLIAFIKYLNAANGSTMTILFQPMGQSAGVRVNANTYVSTYWNDNDLMTSLGNLQKAFGAGSTFASSPDLMTDVEQLSAFGTVRSKVIGKQAFYTGNTLARNPESAYSKQGIIINLKNLAENVYGLKGTIDKTLYDSFRDKYKKLVNEVKKIPESSKLADLLTQADGPVRVNQARYQFQVMLAKIADYQDTVNNARGLEEAIKGMSGYTRNQLKKFVQDSLESIEGFQAAPQAQLTPSVVTKITNASRKLRQALMEIEANATVANAKFAVASLVVDNDVIGVNGGIALAETVKGKIVKRQQSAIVRAQKAALAAISQDAYQEEQMKASFYVAPNMIYKNFQPFHDMLSTNANFKQIGLKFLFTHRALSSIVSLSINAMLPDDYRVAQGQLSNVAKGLKGNNLDARCAATEAYLQELLYTDYVQGAVSFYTAKPVQQQSRGFQQSNVDTFAYDGYQRQLATAKAKLSAAKYDKSSVGGGKAGLRLQSFNFNPPSVSSQASTQQVGFDQTPPPATPDQIAPFAILKAQDLLFMPAFRGDTFYTTGRDTTYTQGMQQKGLTQTQGGTSFLARRFGNTRQEVLSWNPSDAEQLRKQYFVSLYPFKLEGRFKELVMLEKAKFATAAPFSNVMATQTVSQQATVTSQDIRKNLAALALKIK